MDVILEHLLAADRDVRALKLPAAPFRAAARKAVLAPLYAFAAPALADHRAEVRGFGVANGKTNYKIRVVYESNT
eukprot:3530409-Pyramimonas_sp.AAC.1